MSLLKNEGATDAHENPIMANDASATVDIIIDCNKLGMEALKSMNYKECISRLKQAERLLRQPLPDVRDRLLALTMNNLGCYYKK